MSHELRTPLNAILGFSEVLAERMFGEVNEKQAEYLQDILSSGRHLLSLINDILDLSKVEAGRLELELGRFHLPTALDNALTLVRERATRHGITLTQTVDERLGDIVADERKVKQILLNLLSNAVKFTPEGGRVGLTATAADGVITIAVSDTGIGIAPEDQAAIFEEFRQVGREDARKQEGTGLGLTLAKKFVELHGGRIWVQSQVGQGRRSASRCPFGLTKGVRAIRAEASPHGHDVSPVPGARTPTRRDSAKSVGRGSGSPAQPAAPNQPGEKFCGAVRLTAAVASRLPPPRFELRTATRRSTSPRRSSPPRGARGRAQAGHGALRRPQGLDGAARRPRPRGSAEAPRPRPRADDGGRPPLRGHGEPGHGRRDHGPLRRAASPTRTTRCGPAMPRSTCRPPCVATPRRSGAPTVSTCRSASGLNSGEVVVRAIGSDLRMDYTAVGPDDAPGRADGAARHPGHHRLTATRCAWPKATSQVKPLGPVPVKGLEAPIEVYEMAGAGPLRSRFHAAAARGLTRFVGREASWSSFGRRSGAPPRGTARWSPSSASRASEVAARLGSHPFPPRPRLARSAGRLGLLREGDNLPAGGRSPQGLLRDRGPRRPAAVREKMTGKLLTLDRAQEGSLPALLSLLDVPTDDPRGTTSIRHSGAGAPWTR